MPVKSKVSTKTISNAKPKVTPPIAPSSDTPDILPLRTGHCPSLKGLSRLTYELGGGTDDAILLRITDNTGGGHFSDEWVSWKLIELTFQASAPITSHQLRKLFSGKSANNAGFLTAVLLKEGLIEAHPDKRRYYRLTGKAPSLTAAASNAATPSHDTPKAISKKSPASKKASKKQ
jgi:hypothetical protein